MSKSILRKSPAGSRMPAGNLKARDRQARLCGRAMMTTSPPLVRRGGELERPDKVCGNKRDPIIAVSIKGPKT